MIKIEHHPPLRSLRPLQNCEEYQYALVEFKEKKELIDNVDENSQSDDNEEKLKREENVVYSYLEQWKLLCMYSNPTAPLDCIICNKLLGNGLYDVYIHSMEIENELHFVASWFCIGYSNH